MQCSQVILNEYNVQEGIGPGRGEEREREKKEMVDGRWRQHDFCLTIHLIYARCQETERSRHCRATPSSSFCGLPSTEINLITNQQPANFKFDCARTGGRQICHIFLSLSLSFSSFPSSAAHSSATTWPLRQQPLIPVAQWPVPNLPPRPRPQPPVDLRAGQQQPAHSPMRLITPQSESGSERRTVSTAWCRRLPWLRCVP